MNIKKDYIFHENKDTLKLIFFLKETRKPRCFQIKEDQYIFLLESLLKENKEVYGDIRYVYKYKLLKNDIFELIIYDNPDFIIISDKCIYILKCVLTDDNIERFEMSGYSFNRNVTDDKINVICLP